MRTSFDAWLNAIPVDDPIDRRQAVSLQKIILTVIVVGTVGLPISLATPSRLAWLISTSANLIVLGGAVAGLALVRGGAYTRAVVALIIAITTGLSLNVLASGFAEIRGVILIFALPIALAGLLIGRRALLITTGVIFTIIMTIATLERLDPPLAGFLSGPRDVMVTIAALILSIALVAVTLDQFSTTMRAALADIRRANQRLRVELEERRAVEAALRESEDRYRRLTENAPDIIYRYRLVEPRGYEYVNPAIEAILGVTPEEAYADLSLPETLVHPDDAALFQSLLAERPSLPPRTVLRFIARSGAVVWLEFIEVTTSDAHGRAATVEGIARDVSAREESARALRESEAALRMAYEAADLGVWRHDILAGRFTYDERARRHYDVLGNDDTQEAALARIHSDDRERIVRDIRTSHDPAGDGRAAHEYRVVHADGSVHWLAVQAQIYFSGEGEGRTPLFAVGTSQDITERRQLEAQLIQARKMEGIGRLAGGVAHDFNNLLVAIGGYTDLALDSLPPGSPAAPDLQEVQKAADRAAGLTRQLLAFARRQISDPQVINLGDLVADMDQLIRRLIREDIELVIHSEPQLWPVQIDPSQAEQVVVNLVVNARDAMLSGGRLLIEVGNAMLDDAYARRHIAFAPGPYVMLAISDSGVGMSEEVQRHLFEPFFTTKEAGQGTGLGLATCYGIVKQNNGFIWVYSELGQGTTVRIYLPPAEGPPQEVTRRGLSGEVPRGSETVLLAEDEGAVRALAARALREYGYTVLEASDGQEAIELADALGVGTIALLLTDVIMPRLGGRALADALTRRNPALKVLYISGYTDNAIVHQGRLDSGTALLQKPFTPAALARKVREVLDS